MVCFMKYRSEGREGRFSASAARKEHRGCCQSHRHTSEDGQPCLKKSALVVVVSAIAKAAAPCILLTVEGLTRVITPQSFYKGHAD
jgi:hypothetical protein